ncbi:hypothetical protein DPV78_002034 [Talaromyces pinophilus]|nr:hypothetical protein DPV78_002034 [Talaromyces pinophilus]
MIGGTRTTVNRTGATAATTAAVATAATAAVLAERKADKPRCEAVEEERCERGEESGPADDDTWKKRRRREEGREQDRMEVRAVRTVVRDSSQREREGPAGSLTG